MPVFGDSDCYEPGRHTIPDPTKPRLLPLQGRDRVYDALVGKNPHDAPNGRALDWATVVTILVFFTDFVAYFGSAVSPVLEAAGAGEVNERCTNTLTDLYRVIEQRYDYLFSSTLLHSSNPDIVRGFFDRVYSEFLLGRTAREGSDWAEYHQEFLVLRDKAVQKFAAQQAGGRAAGAKDLRNEIEKGREAKKVRRKKNEGDAKKE